MKKNKVIKKVLVLAAWTVVLAGMTVLLIAANQKRKEQVCSKVVVSIKGPGEQFFVEESDILRQLERAQGKLVGRPVPQINLAALERNLESNQWIRNAELYFDREHVLHVFAEEREPIARVFTSGGATFYMDSTGHRMPLMEKMSIRLPVITGFVAPRKNSNDSAWMAGLKKLAWTVYSDPFWRAQTGQIDITADRNFEIIPVVGSHLLRLGDASDLEDKLRRIGLFYKQVMSKAGFHKYAVVDARFRGQIVGVYKGAVSTVDSAQLQKNMEELLQRSTIRNLSEEMMPMADTKDTVSYMSAANLALMKSTADSLAALKPGGKPQSRPTIHEKPAAPLKAAAPSNPKKNEKKQQRKTTPAAKPKAVMQRRVADNPY